MPFIQRIPIRVVPSSPASISSPIATPSTPTSPNFDSSILSSSSSSSSSSTSSSGEIAEILSSPLSPSSGIRLNQSQSPPPTLQLDPNSSALSDIPSPTSIATSHVRTFSTIRPISPPAPEISRPISPQNVTVAVCLSYDINDIRRLSLYDGQLSLEGTILILLMFVSFVYIY